MWCVFFMRKNIKNIEIYCTEIGFARAYLYEGDKDTLNQNNAKLRAEVFRCAPPSATYSVNKSLGRVRKQAIR